MTDEASTVRPDQLEDTYQRFTDFFKSFRSESGSLKYREMIQRLPVTGERSVVVDFNELLAQDPQLARQIIEDPEPCLKSASDAVKSIVDLEDRDYVSKITESGFEFKARLRNVSTGEVKLRMIRAIHIGKLIMVRGIVTRVSEVKPQLVIGIFECTSCGEKIPVPQVEGRFTPPSRCSNPKCGREGPFLLVVEDSKFVDWQKLRIQEMPEELPPGQMPRSIDVIAKDDLVDTARPGDRVAMIGPLISVQDFAPKRGRLTTFRTFIDANYVDTKDKESEKVEITPEEERVIIDLAKDEWIYQKIIKSIAPSIYGLDDIKEAIALALFGGIPKTLPDGVKIRGEINVLLVGDPGTAKSQLLMYTAELAPRGLYTSGKGSSAAGLTAAVMRDSDTGDMTLEAGALVLADRGVACLHPNTKVVFDNRIVTIESLFDENLKTKASSGNEVVEISPLKGQVKAFDIADLDSVDDSCTLVRRKRYVGRLIRANLASGFEIRLTPEHKVVDGDSLQWKEIGSCRPGQAILSPLKLPDTTSPIYVFDIMPDDWIVVLRKEEKDALRKRILEYFRNLSEFNRYFGVTRHVLSGRQQFKIGKLREILSYLGLLSEWREKPLGYGRRSKSETLRINQVTPELAYLIGFVYGDGDYSISKRRSRFAISQSIKKRDIIRNLNTKMHSVTYYDFNKFYRTTRSRIRGKPVISESVTLYRGSNLMAYLIDYFLRDDLRNILMLPQEGIKAFVSGTLDADGCVSIKTGTKSSKKYRTIHAEFLLSNDREKDLAFILALRRLDVYARLKSRKNINAVRVTGRKDVQLLYNSTKTYSIKARNVIIPDRIHKVSSASEKLPRQVVSEICDVISLENKSELLEKGIWSTIYAYKYRKYQPSRQGLLKIANLQAEKLPSLIIDEIDRILKRDYFLDKIVSIEEEHFDGWVYDLYTKHQHNFVGNGILVHNCVDEFDKMNPQDRVAIHQAMEQQTISIAKAGIVATLNARTAILAAANPAFGRYNAYKNPAENISLPVTVLSRFDLIFVITDKPESERDRRMAEHVLSLHSSKGTGLEAPIFPQLLRKYISYAKRNFTPSLTNEAAKKIQEFYLETRAMGENPESPVPITARQLEALVRLAEARAKMGLKKEITVEDADAVIRLMNASLKQVGIDRETGRSDIDTIMVGRTKSQRERIDLILRIVNELSGTSREGFIPVQRIVDAAVSQGVEEQYARDAIEKLLKEGVLFSSSKPGFVKKV